MTVVVVLPGYAPWKVASWAFRDLAARAGELLAEHDHEVLVSAEALNGLHFGLLDPQQAMRVAGALERAALQLRVEYQAAPDPRDREFADALAELALMLSDLTAID